MKILEIPDDSFLNTGSLLRGEQVFTSCLLFEGRILFFSSHLDRLIKGAHFLFPEMNWPSFQNEIHDYVLNRIKNFKGNHYCRLTITGANFFVLIRDHIISSSPITLTKAFQIKTPNLRPAFLKLAQYADSSLELMKASKNGFNEVLFFDQNLFATEASTSNLFIVKTNGEIVTPYSSSMVLEGILREQLMKTFDISEQNLTEDDLINAKELWLSNAIQGLRFVRRFDSRIYEQTDLVFDKIISSFGRFGEKINES